LLAKKIESPLLIKVEQNWLDDLGQLDSDIDENIESSLEP